MEIYNRFIAFTAILLATSLANFSSANETATTNLSELKSSFQQMQNDMKKLKTQYKTERNQLRDSAGGIPEALRTKGGNATVSIGGETGNKILC